VSDIRKSHEDKSLAELAQMIRESMDHARTAWSNALGHVLDAGDALNAAQEQVAKKQVTNWKKWLRDNCFLSVSTAQLYQQLARHRDSKRNNRRGRSPAGMNSSVIPPHSAF